MDDTLYIVFRQTSLKEIEKLVDKIRNYNLYTFKIAVDLGFIVKDTKNDEYSKTYPDIGYGRSIPFTIHSKEEFSSYYQYVLSYIYEKMELTHEGFANRFIGIHYIVFQVTHIQPGKKNDFEVENVLIGAALEVPIYFKKSKNIMSGFNKLGCNCCLALAAIQAKHFFDIEENNNNKNMLRREVHNLFKERHINLSKLEGKAIIALQWYADRFNINFSVQKVINFNENDFEDKNWRPKNVRI